MSQRIELFIDFTKQTVERMTREPDEGRPIMENLVTRLAGDDAAALTALYANYPEFKDPGVTLVKDIPVEHELIDAIARAVRRYNEAIGGRAGAPKFDANEKELQKQIFGQSDGEPNCIQIIIKRDAQGEPVICVEYNFVLHELDEKGMPKTTGFGDYKMEAFSDGKEARGKWQAKFVYDVAAVPSMVRAAQSSRA